MKPDEINIAIAEWHLGYQYRMEGERYLSEVDWQKYPAVYTADGGFIGLSKTDCPIGPNYYGDLNACREALMKLPDDLRHEYHRKLFVLTKPMPFDMWEHNWAFVTAAPDIVSVAIVRTIGKWRGGQ